MLCPYRFTGQNEQAGDQSPEAEDFQADVEDTNECKDSRNRLGERVFDLIDYAHGDGQVQWQSQKTRDDCRGWNYHYISRQA